MNAFTFVTKHNKLSYPQNKIGSSILERLQQLKNSMRPSQPVQQQYESTNTNNNYGLNLSNIQNQRLKKYLPNEGQSKIKTHNEEGTQQFESYRKSLQKKLNSLFQKQKQIMKTQSTYEPSNKYHPSQQYKFEQKTNYPDQIQKKYNQFKAQQANNYQRQKSNTFFTRETKSFSNLNRYPNQIQRQPYQQREHKVFSTIQHVNFTMKSQNMRERKDQQIQQMQRKIKILEMKYLGNNNSQNQKDYQKQLKHDNSNNQKYQKDQNIRQNRSKSTKSKQKKYGTSPDIMKTKMKNSHKQTIESNYFVENNQQQQQEGNKNFITKQSHIKQLKGPQTIIHQKGKRKQRIKEYMNTIDNKSQSEETHNERQLLLQQEFKSLKLQFQTLMEINKSIIQKVQINQEERTRKKQNKLRAKSMLKQILFRLEQIKYEMKNQHLHQDSNSIKNQRNYQKVKSNSLKRQNYHETKSANKKRDAIFQKSSNFNNNNIIKQPQSQNIKQKPTLSKQKDTSTKLSPNKKINKQKEPDINDIEKLKLLLDLQIQHRNIVQKKLQVIYGSKNATIQ